MDYLVFKWVISMSEYIQNTSKWNEISVFYKQRENISSPKRLNICGP